MAFGNVITDWWNYMFNNDAFDPPPPSIMVALWDGNPGIWALDNNELAGGGYARVEVPSNMTNWATTGVVNEWRNWVEIAFPEATAYWGYVRYVCLFGKTPYPYLLMYGALTTEKEIDEGSVAKFKSGDLIMALL